MSLNEPTLLIPSPAHIALALVTVRSKPAHIRLEDYLAMLSSAVIQNHNLDAALLWKQAFERAEREKAQLQDYIQRFESQRLDTSDSAAAGPRKRKAETEQPVKANTQSKRRELDRDSPHAISTTTDLASHVVDDDPSKNILRQIFYLNCLVRSSSPPLHELCIRIGSFCQAAETILSSIMTTHKPDSIAALSSILEKGYLVILNALDHAASREALDNDLTIANGSIVQLFQCALSQLHRLALDEVTRREEEERSRGKKTNSNTKATTADHQTAKNNLKSLSKAVTGILICMLTSFDAAKDSHCELLEGLLCSLFDHIGSCLSLLVFADPNASKGDVGIAPPAGLEHVSHLKTTAAMTAAEVEGPYLAAVLRRGLGFLRDKQQEMSPYMKEIFSWEEQKDIIDPAVLREKIEARLQGTLLRGVFGDDDQAFENALRREHPLEDADVQIIEHDVGDDQQDKSTLFIGQVWEQLGWEMLSGRPKQQEKDN